MAVTRTGRGPATPRRFAAALLLLSSLAAGGMARADDRAVEAIRIDYEALGKRIEAVRAGGDGAAEAGLYVNRLTVNARSGSWPGAGTYTAVVRFHYEAGDERPVPDRLRKIEIEGQSGARRYYQEFFYAADGSLLFHYRRGPDGVERRLYLRSGRPLKAIRLVDGQGARDHPTAADRKWLEQLDLDAQRLEKLFAGTLDIPLD